MDNAVLIYAGAGVAVAWGIAHALPVRHVVAGFEPLSEANRRILTMAWVSEAMTLVFIGVLALLAAPVVSAGGPLGRRVCAACAGMLVVMAVWTRLTGGRTRQVGMRLCPLVKTGAAALLWAGAWLR
jgi:hypothetical protein